MPTEGASEAFEHATLHYPTIRDIADEELGLLSDPGFTTWVLV